MDISHILALAIENKASDIHIVSGLKPRLRLNGELHELDIAPLSAAATAAGLLALLTPNQQQEFADIHELDFALELPKMGRFRGNIFQQQHGINGVFRVIHEKILSLVELNFPPIIQQICTYQHGLVLVTGSTGSGKSTTLAAMVDYLNQTRRAHILTLEDPIEFIHQSKLALINQREVGTHTTSFATALRAALREDPDVILVGELRDLATIRLALTAAETGHLVLASLHTVSAAKTIHRLVDVFPAAEKELVRTMLSETLRAVISQTLLPKIPEGRIAAQEILICNAAVRHLIREDKIPQIYSAIQTSSKEGMRTLDAHLQALVAANEISLQVAAQFANDKQLFA